MLSNYNGNPDERAGVGGGRGRTDWMFSLGQLGKMAEMARSPERSIRRITAGYINHKGHSPRWVGHKSQNYDEKPGRIIKMHKFRLKDDGRMCLHGLCSCNTNPPRGISLKKRPAQRLSNIKMKRLAGGKRCEHCIHGKKALTPNQCLFLLLPGKCGLCGRYTHCKT